MSDSKSTTFTQTDERISELLVYLREIKDLEALGNLAGWDLHTAMPKGSGPMRAEQLATLQGVLYERRTSRSYMTYNQNSLTGSGEKA